jgi:beta-glucosidase
VSGSGRYVRMYGTQRGTQYGYSLWEFQVYGS